MKKRVSTYEMGEHHIINSKIIRFEIDINFKRIGWTITSNKDGNFPIDPTKNINQKIFFNKFHIELLIFDNYEYVLIDILSEVSKYFSQIF